MQEALKNGAEKVSDGWGMLVEQGAESFRLWTNLIPDTSRLLEKPIDQGLFIYNSFTKRPQKTF